jgi:hypothetical protein
MRRNIDMFKALCGYTSYSNVAVATTMWTGQEGDWADFTRRESQLQMDPAFFGSLIADGVRMFRHAEHGRDAAQEASSARQIVAHVVSQSRLAPVILLLQHELVDERKALSQTSAGVVLLGDLAQATAEHIQQIATVRAEIGAALARQDQAHAAELKSQRDEIQARLSAAEQGHQSLEVSLAELHAHELGTWEKRLSAPTWPPRRPSYWI